MKNNIIHITDWITAEEVPTIAMPSYEELFTQYGKYTGTSIPRGNSLHGVYQWADSKDIEAIGEDIIHKDIGYIGTAKRNIVERTRAVAVPAGRHPVKMAISAGDVELKNLKVRYLITSSDPDSVKAKHNVKLETYLHKNMDKKFGYRYKWVNAQLSNSNKHNYVLQNWRELTYEQAEKILPEVIAITKQLGAEYIDARVDAIVNGDNIE